MEYTNTLKVLNEFANEVVEGYKAGLTQYNAIATHNLINSVRVNTVSMDGSKMYVTISLEKYWMFIEDGRKAYGNNYKGHLPPIKAIEEWIAAKPIIPGDTNRGVPSYAALTPELNTRKVATSTQSLAWAIATNIAKKGIDPKPILKNTVEGILSRFKDEIGAAVAKDYGQLMVGAVGEVFSGVEIEKVNGSWVGNVTYDTLIL